MLRRACIASAARLMPGRAERTAATAAIWPSINASRISPGSQRSMSEYRGLARSVSMAQQPRLALTPWIKPYYHHFVLTIGRTGCASLESSAVDQNVLLLGVDGGGTRCRARLSDFSGKILAEAETGPANLCLGVAQSFSAVVEAVDRC